MGLANHRILTRAALAAAVLIAPLGARAQTNYAAEAARNPGAASKPTLRTADGHPDLNGVWHHFFGIGTIEKVGDSFTVGGAFSPQNRALYNTPLGDSKPPYMPSGVLQPTMMSNCWEVSISRGATREALTLESRWRCAGFWPTPSSCSGSKHRLRM